MQTISRTSKEQRQPATFRPNENRYQRGRQHRSNPAAVAGPGRSEALWRFFYQCPKGVLLLKEYTV